MSTYIDFSRRTPYLTVLPTVAKEVGGCVAHSVMGKALQYFKFQKLVF